MKMLKKFSRFLLENHPLLWHTRTIQLTIAALFLWLLSFVIGYASTNMSILRSYSLDSHYFISGFNFFHIAVVIILLALWALQFFKNNAFKALYPLGKFYFHKMFFLLFIPFLLLISCYLPFTKGAHVKTRQLLDKEKLLETYATISQTDAFLPNSNSEYAISKKVYPGPFPLNSNYYKTISNKWDDNYLKIHIPATDSTDEKFADYIVDEKYTTTIGASKFQFYRSNSFPINACDYDNAITKFYVFDAEKDFLQLNSIWNFRGKGDRNEFIFPKAAKLDDYRGKYAPNVFKWSKNKDWKTIKSQINKVASALDQYGVSYKLEADTILKYLEQKDFRNFKTIVSSNTITEYELKDKLRRKSMTMTDYNALSFIDRMEFSPTQFINKYQLDYIYTNYDKINATFLPADELSFYLFFALAVTLIMVFFQIIKPIPFLLSLPVWGVLFIFVGLYFAFGSRRIFSSDVRIFIPFLLLLLTVHIVNLLLLYYVNKGKNLVNITISMAILSAGFVLPVIIGLIHKAGKHRVAEDCGDFHYEYLLGKSFVSPLSIWFFSLIGILLVLFLAKKWFAKSE